MEVINVSGLKNNPSEALRMSHRGVVVVMNRDTPDALMLGLEHAGGIDAKGASPLWRRRCFGMGTCRWLALHGWRA